MGRPFPSVPVAGGKAGGLCHVGDGDKAAASPNYKITCKSSSICLSPQFQLSEGLYSSSSEAYSALFLLIIGIRAISGNPG